MKALILVIIAVLCNVGAQVALKYGATTEMRLQSFLSLPIFCGVVLYGISFILTIRIYADFPLSVISPVMAGAIFLLISVLSAVLFAEPLTTSKIGGILLIAAGIGLLSQSA